MMNNINRGARRSLLLVLGGLVGASLILTYASCVSIMDLGEDVQAPYQTHTFDHALHMANSCDLCHHAGAEGQSCDATGCHQSEWVGGVPSLKEAKQQTCFTCHNQKTADGSQDCSFCHTALLGS